MPTVSYAGRGDLSPRTQKPPTFPDALVGTYLKSLPDDGSDDLDDGTAPTVE
jgi:hypothetical protein